MTRWPELNRIAVTIRPDECGEIQGEGESEERLTGIQGDSTTGNLGRQDRFFGIGSSRLDENRLLDRQFLLLPLAQGLSSGGDKIAEQRMRPGRT